MFYQVDKNNLILFVYLIPKSSVDKIIGIESKDGEKQYLTIRLRAVPEDGKANKALIKFLAKQWKIPPSSISLTSGATSRYKRLHFFNTFRGAKADMAILWRLYLVEK